MSWAKRNLYFLISCIIAVVLLGAAGWYCFSQWQGNNQAKDDVTQAIQQLKDLSNKPVTADKENIEIARTNTALAQALSASLQKYVTPIPLLPSFTNPTNIDDRTLTFAMRDTVGELRRTAAQYNVTLTQPDFAFSFSAQLPKAVYAASSHDQLARQLSEIKAISSILFSNRILSLDLLQRERTSDDVGATQPDYTDALSITNGTTVISPYVITFQAFDEQLAGVLAGFANQSHGMIVRALDIEPTEMVPVGETMPMTPGGGMPPGTYPPPAGGVGAAGARAGPQVVWDEKKLKIILLLDLVKLSPPQGR